MSADATGLFIAIFLIGTTFIAFRTAFFGVKLVVGMIWFVAFMYIQSNPPTGITEGSAVHTGLMLVCIGMGLMIVLAGLGRGIDQTRDRTGAFSTKSEGFQFKIPDWLKGSESPEATRQRREQSNEEYREKVHRALHPSRRRK